MSDFIFNHQVFEFYITQYKEMINFNNFDREVNYYTDNLYNCFNSLKQIEGFSSIYIKYDTFIKVNIKYHLLNENTYNYIIEITPLRYNLYCIFNYMETYSSMLKYMQILNDIKAFMETNQKIILDNAKLLLLVKDNYNHIHECIYEHFRCSDNLSLCDLERDLKLKLIELL